MNVTRATHYRVLPGLMAVAVLGCTLTVAQDKKTISSKAAAAKPESFGGSYASLLPPQKRLIDGYFQRASEALGKPIDPETAYNNLRLSVRSTFDAVTHALSRQQLTGKDGKKYGTALDLVDIVEGVAGERKGAGGDEQFRIYVLLKPDAYDVLTKAKEFERQGDNTVYHKGYPICFRSLPAVPSIQFSLTRDHMRADVDVDYRSSKFPKAVVNGHLTASNSDVRAGNNLERHDSRWAGLSGWWQSLFGLPQIKARAEKSWSEGTVAVAPNADPDQLTHDLSDGVAGGPKRWAGERVLLAPSVSLRGNACAEARSQGGTGNRPVLAADGTCERRESRRPGRQPFVGGFGAGEPLRPIEACKE